MTGESSLLPVVLLSMLLVLFFLLERIAEGRGRDSPGLLFRDGAWNNLQDTTDGMRTFDPRRLNLGVSATRSGRGT